MNIRNNNLPEKFDEFLEKYQGNFEKRKYFKINQNLDIIEREPSWVLELALIYYKEKSSDVLVLLNNELEKCYKAKIKKIDRLSKYSISELSDKFWRALFNRDGIHAIRLGNEVYLRDKKLFLEIVYKYSFIMSDVNKLIKAFLFEILCEKSSYKPEFMINLVNYFSNSDQEYIKYGSEEYMDYFNKYKTDELYKNIYEKKYKEYNMKELQLSSVKGLSPEKKKIHIYLKEEGFL